MQDWTDSKLPEQGILSCFSVVPKVLLAGAITLMDEGYFKLAVWLNDKGMPLSSCRVFDDKFQFPILIIQNFNS